MSGVRRPMDVNLACGSKHWTQAEIEARRRGEVKVSRPARLACPKWLGKEAAKLFRVYARQLLENLPVSSLDAGTLARMCDAEWSYAEASRQKDTYLLAAAGLVKQSGPGSASEELATCQEQIAYWTKQMAAYEKIARGCANDLGCTITSRCRLVVPDTGQPEVDPLEQLQQRLRVVNG